MVPPKGKQEKKTGTPGNPNYMGRTQEKKGGHHFLTRQRRRVVDLSARARKEGSLP